MPENLDVAVARLDERVKTHDSLIEQVAKDLSRMATSYEELVKNNQRIGLVELEMANHKESLTILWSKFDENERAKKKAADGIIFEFFKLVIAAVAGAVLGHFGIHLA